MKSIILISLFLLCSCAPDHIDVSSCVSSEPDGFFMGLWHGVIAPITFIISLFNDSVEIWSVNNNGGWYSFGFILGAGILSFGSSKA